MEIPFELIVALISTISGVIAALLLARRASERIEELSERRITLEQEIDVLSIELKSFVKIIEVKDREIESLKSKLKEKDEKIAEMKEAIKIAQRISERDLGRIEENLGEIAAIVKEMVKTLEEEEKRGKKK